MADRPTQNLEDTARRHEGAFFDWWSGLTVDYGDLSLGIAEGANNPYNPVPRNGIPILRIPGPVQRAAAEMVDILVASGWIAGTDPDSIAANAADLKERARENHAVLPMPFLSIVADLPVPRPEDAGVAKLFRKQCFDQTTQEFQAHRWPGSYEIPFRVTLYAIKKYTVVYCREWLHSQIGPVGMGPQEVLIPVEHEYPWNRIQQTLTFDGESDLSELEGEDNARGFRIQWDFRLKMWHFHRIAATYGVVESVGVPVSTVVPDGVTVEEDEIDCPAETPLLSLNFFEFYLADNLIPTQWPKSGNATVRRGTTSPGGTSPAPTLRMTMTDPTDEVSVSNKSLALDADGIAVFVHDFRYRSDAATELVFAQRDPAVEPVAWENARLLTLPAASAWTQVQDFTLVDQLIYSLSARGTGVDATLHLSEQRLHRLNLAGKVAPDSSTPGGGQTVHSWAGLEDRPYLAIVHFADAGVSAGSIDVDGTPTAIDPAEQQGFVTIFNVTGGTATVTIPDTIPIQGAWLFRYKSFWNGSQL